MDYKTFWTQPAKGFTERTRGRTEEEIQAEEGNIGFKYPYAYRELMKLQNGGYSRRTSLLVDGKLFDMSFPMDELPSTHYKNMREWLEEGESEEEIQAHSKTGHCFPERLIIISGMHGHEFMCLDYGWDQKELRTEPELCFMYQEFEEFLRLPSFDALLESSVYYGTRCEEYKFGIDSELSIANMADRLSKFFGIEMVEKTDSRSGWYNFEKWYVGNLDIENNASLTFILTPNKFLSGTFLVQSKPDINHILGIQPREDGKSYVPNSSKYLQIIKEHFEQFELFSAMEELFIIAEVKEG